MRAICRVLGERMFNTCGAPGCPAGIYICGEYRGHITRIRRELSRDYTVCVFVSQRERKRSSSASPLAESRICARVRKGSNLGTMCTRAHGVNRNRDFPSRTSPSFPSSLSPSTEMCVITRARAHVGLPFFFFLHFLDRNYALVISLRLVSGILAQFAEHVFTSECSCGNCASIAEVTSSSCLIALFPRIILMAHIRGEKLNVILTYNRNIIFLHRFIYYVYALE